MIAYKCISFKTDKEICYISKPFKQAKICRFCEKSTPFCSFEGRSHSISEGLGNTKYITLDECDQCNNRFSRYESDLINLLSFYLRLYNIAGKKKDADKPKTLSTVDGSFKMYNQYGVLFFQTNGFSLGAGLEGRYQLKTHSFVPNNIFRSLYKFGISFLRHEHLPYFSELAHSILRKEFIPQDLPCFVFSSNEIFTQPIIQYYIFHKVKNYNPEFPFCFVQLKIASFDFLYILPSDKSLVSEQQIFNFICIARQIFVNKTPSFIFEPSSERIRPVLSLKIEPFLNDKNVIFANTTEGVNSILTELKNHPLRGRCGSAAGLS